MAPQERLAGQREEVRRRAAEIDDALAELDERRREAEHRETLLAAEDERLADALSQARLNELHLPERAAFCALFHIVMSMPSLAMRHIGRNAAGTCRNTCCADACCADATKH